jgi:pyruvate/2-oxoglutarate dehydrogenase complex dihydrolipoamide dehydrogenase (E3) component
MIIELEDGGTVDTDKLANESRQRLIAALSALGRTFETQALVLAIAGLAHTDNGFLVVNDRERFNMWLVEGDRSAAPVTPTTRQ